MKKLILILLLLVGTVEAKKVQLPFLGRGSIDVSSIEDGNCKLVKPGDNLQTSYNWLKSSSRDGVMGALSATNRRVLVLSPGKYLVTTPFTLDTSYVDVIAAVPSMGTPPAETMYEWTYDVGNVKYYPTSSYSSPNTVIYGSFAGNAAIATYSVVVQSANDVQLMGFGILNSWTLTPATGTASVSGAGLNIYRGAGFCITATANTPSVYTGMWFWCNGAGLYDSSAAYWCRHSCLASTGRLGGLWRNCISNGWGYRQENTTYTINGEFYDCIGGAFSFGGDITSALVFQGKWIRCRATAHFEAVYEDTYPDVTTVLPGSASFMGCRTFSGAIGANAVIEDCIGGDHSFVMRNYIAGKLYRCRAGSASFAGTNLYTVVDNAPVAAIKSTAYLEDCFAIGNSFAGGISHSYVAGTLVRCRNDGSGMGWNLVGGKLENCRFTVSTTGQNCIKIHLNGSRLYGNTFIAGSSAKSISAFSQPFALFRGGAGYQSIYQDSSPACFISAPATNWRFYIPIVSDGTTAPTIDRIDFDLATGGTYVGGAGTASVKWKFSNGASTFADMTSFLTADTTNAGGADSGPLMQDGYITFNTLTGWTSATWNNHATFFIICEVTTAVGTNFNAIPTLANVVMPVICKTVAGHTAIMNGNQGNLGLDTDMTSLITGDTSVWDADMN